MRRHLEKIVTVVVLLATSATMGLNYVWLSDRETSLMFPGDIIRFYGGDTLIGPVHSNDWIATTDASGLPVFYGVVSTTKSSFRPGSPSPAGIFLGGPPVFNADNVGLPENADLVRAVAATQQHEFTESDLRYRIEIAGDSIHLFDYPAGLPFEDFARPHGDYSLLDEGGVWFFFSGDVSVRGTMSPLGATLVVGSEGDIHFVDDTIIEGADEDAGLPTGCTSRMAFMSEQQIIIDNTWENGREGCSQGCSIFINAALCALGGSLQIEQQNDAWDPYISSVQPDERGRFVLIGGLVQRYRGYFHRQNLGGTGYGSRRLVFDSRLAFWDIFDGGTASGLDILDFGEVPTGQSAWDTLSIADGNSFSGAWTSLPFTAAQFYQFNPPFLVPVSFTPTGPGEWTGTLTYYISGDLRQVMLRGIGIAQSAFPIEPSLYPNPFNSEVKLKFELADAGEVRAVVYDVLGRETARIADGVFQAGEHAISINASAWASGVYFLRLETPERIRVMKMVMVR